MSLTEDLLSQLQGAPLQNIASQLGLDPAQTGNAVGAAIPLLLGALGNNAAHPQGAQALLGALGSNHSGLDLGSVLGSVLGGGNAGAASNGAGILGHVFGSRQDNAASGLAQASGLSNDRSAQLLKILAPLVMAYLAKRVFSSGQASEGQLGELLGQGRPQPAASSSGAGGLLGKVLDQDGDGQVGIGDLIKLGSGLLGTGKR